MNEQDPAPDNFENEIPLESTTEAAPANDESAALRQEIVQIKDQMLRALAEAENSRKRAIRERDDAGKYAIASFAKDLVNVSDNLARALDAIPKDALAADPHLKNLTDGIEATQRELLKTFDKNGIRSIRPLDEPFNPNFHEVMFEAPGSGKPAGTVIQVIEIGYILHDRLLRPARVGVAKAEGPPGGTIDTQA